MVSSNFSPWLAKKIRRAVVSEYGYLADIESIPTKSGDIAIAFSSLSRDMDNEIYGFIKALRYRIKK